jgi:hypothetical protein
MLGYAIAKELLKRADPTGVFRSQAPSDWQGDFPLPSPVADYFLELGPVDVWIRGCGNPYFLPTLAGLWEFQLGYRTDGWSHERCEDWSDDWLVVADEGGDPFILTRSEGSVLHAFHGEGVWEPIRIFDNLAEMATALAILGDIVCVAGNGLTDDDCLILPRYREEARTRLGELLRSDERAATVVSRLGWN